MSTNTDGRRVAAATRRKERERALLDATRKLFDQRGMGEAQIEEIANEVGINRALVYRHSTGKEELFALTLCDYLVELRDALQAGAAKSDDPFDKISGLVDAFVDYSIAYPAFVDCANTLMRRTGEELFGEISEHVMYTLGAAIADALQIVVDTLDDGVAKGVFFIQDTVLTGNLLYASSLGAVQLARVGVLVKTGPQKLPDIGSVTADDVRRHLVAAALAFTRPAPATSGHGQD